MTPEIERALQEQAEVSITTYDAADRPGTVPIWFAYAEGAVYMATGRDSRKVRKLQANPRVRLTLGGKNGATLEGKGRICSEEELVRRAALVLNAKYRGAWGPNDQMVQRLLGGDIVLVRITPLPEH